MTTKLKILTITLLLATLSSLGQTSYPIAKLIDRDTIILITPNQLKYANRNIATIHYLESRLIKLSGIILNKDNTIKLQSELTNQLEIKINALNIEIEALTKLSDQKATDYTNEAKRERKKKRRAVITGIGAGIIIGLIGSMFI